MSLAQLIIQSLQTVARQRTPISQSPFLDSPISEKNTEQCAQHSACSASARNPSSEEVVPARKIEMFEWHDCTSKRLRPRFPS